MRTFPGMVFCFVATLLLTGITAAENFDIYPFASADEEARFEQLTHELRCPKCQNQSLADSNAPIARDLRQRTYELVREGRSNDEVVAYLKERYGEFITYKPAFNAVTALLWAGPFLLLAVVLAVLLPTLRRRAASQAALPASTAAGVDDAEARRAAAILARFDDGAGNGGEPRP